MDDRHLVVVLEEVVAKRGEDLADAAPAEVLELGGPQRAHAGAAEHMHALRHRPEDLLVPDRRHLMEVAVDDADDPGTIAPHRAVYIPLAHRRQVVRVQDLARVLQRQRGTQEDAGVQGVPLRIASARAPGT